MYPKNREEGFVFKSKSLRTSLGFATTFWLNAKPGNYAPLSFCFYTPKMDASLPAAHGDKNSL